MLFALGLFVLQVQPTPSKVYVPPSSWPIAATAGFKDAFGKTLEALSKSDFDAAAQFVEVLPKRSFGIVCDSSAVPDPLKEGVQSALSRSMQDWRLVKGLDPKLGSDGELHIRFVTRLPNGPQGIPAASKVTVPTPGQLDVEIGLHRGNPAQLVDPTDVYGEITHAIGAYLGLADDPVPGSPMYRDDRPAVRVFQLPKLEIMEVDSNLTMVEQLREDIVGHKPIQMAAPISDPETIAVDLGKIRQGVKPLMDIKITNHGGSLLRYLLVPDCGCFSTIPPGNVQAGEVGHMMSTVNTSEYAGPVTKHLMLYTNDPAHSAQEIEVKFFVEPLFRLYRPEGDVVVINHPGTTVELLLTLPKDSKIFPGRFEWSGLPATVTMEPWQGAATDPQMNEDARPRNGFRFHVKIGDDLLPGRSPGTLMVETGDRQFPYATYSIYVQKGIAAMPGSVSLGSVGTVRRSSFLLSRPETPFHIKGVTVGSKTLSATVTPLHGEWEYRVDVVYDGTAPRGQFDSTIEVRTDDAKQPLIEIPVSGIVR